MEFGYRVEVNQKSKYFDNRRQATDYFMQQVVKNLNCELWFITTSYNEAFSVYVGTQTLLDYYSSKKVGT